MSPRSPEKAVSVVGDDSEVATDKVSQEESEVYVVRGVAAEGKYACWEVRSESG